MNKSKKATVEEAVKALKPLTPAQYRAYQDAVGKQSEEAAKVRRDTVQKLLHNKKIHIGVSDAYAPTGFKVCHPQVLRGALDSMGFVKPTTPLPAAKAKAKSTKKTRATKAKAKTTRPAPAAAKVMVAKAFDSNELGDAVAALIESAQEIGYARAVKLLQVFNEENTEHHV